MSVKGVVLCFLVREFRFFTINTPARERNGVLVSNVKAFFENEETTTCKSDTRRKDKRDKTCGPRCRPWVLDSWTFQSVLVRLEPVTDGSLSLFTKLDLQVFIVAE